MSLTQRIKAKLFSSEDPDEGLKSNELKISNQYQWGLLAKTSQEIEAYIEQIKREIEDVQNGYKGFIDLEDEEFFEQKEDQDADARDIEEKYTSLKRDFAK